MIERWAADPRNLTEYEMSRRNFMHRLLNREHADRGSELVSCVGSSCGNSGLTFPQQIPFLHSSTAPSPAATFSCACKDCKSSPPPSAAELAKLSTNLLATFRLAFTIAFNDALELAISKLVLDGPRKLFSAVALDPDWPTLIAECSTADEIATSLAALLDGATLSKVYGTALCEVLVELTRLSPTPICIGTLLRDPSLLRRTYAFFLTPSIFV